MTSELTVVEPREWLIVEGLFVMCYPDLVEMADVKAFIHTSPEVRLARRKDRDLNVRGYAQRRWITSGSIMSLPRRASNPIKRNVMWSSTTTTIGRLA